MAKSDTNFDPKLSFLKNILQEIRNLQQQGWLVTPQPKLYQPVPPEKLQGFLQTKGFTVKKMREAERWQDEAWVVGMESDILSTQRFPHDQRFIDYSQNVLRLIEDCATTLDVDVVVLTLELLDFAAS